MRKFSILAGLAMQLHGEGNSHAEIGILAIDYHTYLVTKSFRHLDAGAHPSKAAPLTHETQISRSCTLA